MRVYKVSLHYVDQFLEVRIVMDSVKDYIPIIYCPECDTPFEIIEAHRCYCGICQRFFSEDEVRKRCGL